MTISLAKVMPTIRRRPFLIAGVAASNVLLIVALVIFISSLRPHFALEVKNASATDKSVSVFQLEPGNKFVIVDVSITARTKTAVWITPVTQSAIVDQQGKAYAMAPYVLERPFVADVYNPGQTASGQLSYKVPANARGLKFCYRLEGATRCRQLSAPGL